MESLVPGPDPPQPLRGWRRERTPRSLPFPALCPPLPQPNAPRAAQPARGHLLPPRGWHRPCPSFPCPPSPVPPSPAPSLPAAAHKMAAALGRLLRSAVPAAGRRLPGRPQLLARRQLSLGASRLAPAVTQHAPFFKGTAVVHGEFKELSLDDFKGKYLVLFFYPLDFTFVCPTEIVAFSNKANEFRDVNCEVVAVSVDSHFCHLAWINTPRKSGGLGKMNIPVLSDLTKQISRDYGVLLEGPGIALRGLFIIDPNGVIKHLSINDLPVGRSVEETLRLVKAFQYVETHGEVCPANWTPDSPTIKPSPEASKEYFEKVHK
ncbi:thioredoxin-dependent peroxide reductase, mitochondrial [Oxyura jamaicensis]|uniref:thioredoxin-dependent peroxide reductase, mitochondrial n=1 Tax=Oxyura jamaicensis TaxID=8884 RepID=UPI0015A59572|nr:thioredoxin-dependent peroxide reductase, mitochondrial [Oxyura jamaicensis]